MNPQNLFLVVNFTEKKDIFGNDDNEIHSMFLTLAENEDGVRKNTIVLEKSSIISLEKTFNKKTIWTLDMAILYNFIPYLIKRKIKEFENKGLNMVIG